jgi:hypothetical protein
MNLRNKYGLILTGIYFYMNIGVVSAQGDGPKAFQLTPKGLWGINAKWMDLNQNLLPTGNILIKDADIQVDVFPITAFHTFGIKNTWVQLMAMANPGSASGSLATNLGPTPTTNASGFSDGFVGFKVGLFGAPALSIEEFVKKEPSLSIMSLFRVWYSGTYDASKELNLGSNRTTFEFGLPVIIPFAKTLKHPIWLETVPSLQIFTANNNPTFITFAEKSHQLPLFILENHLTHNITEKLWAGLDLRFQYGGVLELDNVKQDNKINILGGGLSAGYQVLPFLSASAGYGSILFGDNNAQSDMIRLSLIFVYAKINEQ